MLVIGIIGYLVVVVVVYIYIYRYKGVSKLEPVYNLLITCLKKA